MSVENEMSQNETMSYVHPPFEGYSPIPGVVKSTSGPDFKKSDKTGTCVVKANRPMIPVPLVQQILNKETIVEVEQVQIQDKIQPRVYMQDVYHETPKLAIGIQETPINVPNVKIKEVQVDVDVPININLKVNPSYNDRMVPRLFPKFCGKQEIVEVVIPKLQFVDCKEYHEIPIYIGERIVEKEVVEEVGINKNIYRYALKEVEVPIYKYRPVFDVDVVIPKPLIVPVPMPPQEVNAGTTVIGYEEYRKKRRLLRKSKEKPVDAIEPTNPPRQAF